MQVLNASCRIATGREVVAKDGTRKTITREGNPTLRWVDYFLAEHGGLKSIVARDGKVVDVFVRF